MTLRSLPYSICSIYHKFLHPEEESRADCLQLSRDDRQHRYVNTIKLIEAAPCATLAQTTEYFAKCQIVHALSAVSHHAQQTHGFG